MVNLFELPEIRKSLGYETQENLVANFRSYNQRLGEFFNEKLPTFDPKGEFFRTRGETYLANKHVLQEYAKIRKKYKKLPMPELIKLVELRSEATFGTKEYQLLTMEYQELKTLNATLQAQQSKSYMLDYHIKIGKLFANFEIYFPGYCC